MNPPQPALFTRRDLLHQWRRCFGQRWLRRVVSVLVGAAAVLAGLCAPAAAVRAVMQSADPQALAFYSLLTLHFLALAAALPWVWWRRGWMTLLATSEGSHSLGTAARRVRV